MRRRSQSYSLRPDGACSRRPSREPQAPIRAPSGSRDERAVRIEHCREPRNPAARIGFGLGSCSRGQANFHCVSRELSCGSRLPRGGVDRNARATGSLGATMGSPPSRGRGSKLRGTQVPAAHPLSPPSRGRGSKRDRRVAELHGRLVASLAGAWIETRAQVPRSSSTPCRLPRGGVDRNILSQASGGAPRGSPPSRGRGSKRRDAGPRARRCAVASLAGAWIETPASVPTRRPRKPSPPSRGRGSKLLAGLVDRLGGLVASLAGARIETARGRLRARRCRCRLPRGGVDRNSASVIVKRPDDRRLPRGGVDRNNRSMSMTDNEMESPPSRGRGSKPGRRGIERYLAPVASLAGAWIETSSSPPSSSRT